MNVTHRTAPTDVAFRRRVTRAAGLLSSVTIAVGFGAVAASPAAASATVDCTVDNTVVSDGTDQTSALQAVLDESSVLCLSGSFTLSSELRTFGDLTIYGQDSAVLDGASTSRILRGSESSSSSVVVDSVRFQNGYTEGDGGAIKNNGPVSVTNSEFVGNVSSASGGAIWSLDVVTIGSSEFSENGSSDLGGAVTASDVFVTTSMFDDNSGAEGGAIRGYGFVTVTDSVFIGNAATVNGGAVSAGIDLDVSGSVFQGNDAAANGGAIFSRNSTSVTDSAFAGNAAAASGGAVAADQSLRVLGSTFEGNVAAGNGGALFGPNFVQITNSTFVSNSGDEGGAVYHGSGEISFSTFLDNSAAAPEVDGEIPGDALYKEGPVVASLKGNIFAGASSTPQLGTGSVSAPAPYSDVSGNLFSTSSGVEVDFEAGESSVFDASVEAIFGSSPATSDNGGPTPTLALVAGSPAIDLVEATPVVAEGRGSAPVSVDQRGVERGELLDAGAFEFVASDEEIVPEVTPAALPELAATGPTSVTGMAGLAALLLALGAALTVLRRRVRV